MNMVALVDGQPRLLNIKQMLQAFLAHRREVVTRRTVFELRSARERGHVLEGLAVALANVDEMIELIKAAPTPPVAKERLLGAPGRSSVVREMSLARHGRVRGWSGRLPAPGPGPRVRPAGRRSCTGISERAASEIPADAPVRLTGPRAGQASSPSTAR
jgi:DNA gyrase/topoisomerase IV subunit A